MVKNIKIHSKAHFLNQRKLISVTELLAICKVAYDTSRIYKKGAIFVLPFPVKRNLATMLKICIFFATITAFVVALICTVDPMSTRIFFENIL